jgi:hypothetical protein
MWGAELCSSLAACENPPTEHANGNETNRQHGIHKIKGHGANSLSGDAANKRAQPARIG